MRTPVKPGAQWSPGKSHKSPPFSALTLGAGLTRTQGWEGLPQVSPPSPSAHGAHERPRSGQRLSGALSLAGRPLLLGGGTGAALFGSALEPVLGVLSKPEPCLCLPLGRCFQIWGPQRQQVCEAGRPWAPCRRQPTPIRGSLAARISALLCLPAGRGGCGLSGLGAWEPSLPLQPHLCLPGYPTPPSALFHQQGPRSGWWESDRIPSAEPSSAERTVVTGFPQQILWAWALPSFRQTPYLLWASVSSSMRWA